jgi:cation diffusion facilitator CzcD-associated flavoprotein CzcO/acetyl esterase/lipase
MRIAERLWIFVLRLALRAIAPRVLSPGLGVQKQRRRAELGLSVQILPRGTRIDTASLGGVPTERVEPRNARPGTALLYLHGGGLCICSPRTHRGVAARLAAASEATAYVPDYRLAPEHPYPAAIDDAHAAYRALLADGIAPERIVVAGDSAGGGLALALAMRLRDRGEPLPAALALISPWLNAGADIAGTRRPEPRDPMQTLDDSRAWAHAYLPSADPERAADPDVSPLNGNLAGLPPLLLHWGSDDILAQDSEQLVERAQTEGIRIERRRLDGLWHDLHLFAPVLPVAAAATAEMGRWLRARLLARSPAPRIAIVGAGMSGLCMGTALKHAGIDDFTIYEKADEVGGTWRENRYPGLSCDVPSRFYSYSFAPNPDWSSVFSPGPEIQRYFSGIADEYGLRPSIRFGSEVSEARWDEAAGRWELQTREGHRDSADVLVTATGVLHHPRFPEIPGMDSFSGKAFHSAQWDDSAELAGKRVAIIGTGSTGVQMTAAIAGVAERLLVFQRTAQWILPVRNRAYSRFTRRILTQLGWVNRLGYHFYRGQLEIILGDAVTRDGFWRRFISGCCRLNLRFGVKDPELRRKLTPDYQPMCKRLVMSSEFYPAMQRDDVELVTEAIDHVEERGIVTADGRLHELDVIVLATGFDAHAYMRPMNIVGENGVTLEQAWENGPRAYRTVGLPGFPNMFMLMGPHSPIGNHSLIAVAETQTRYAMHWIERIRAGEIRSVVPKPDATARFNEEMRAAMPGTVWTTGCSSWYLDADGVPELWPWTAGRHREMLKVPLAAEYEITTRNGGDAPAETKTVKAEEVAGAVEA